MKTIRTALAAPFILGGIPMLIGCSTANYPRLTEPNAAYLEAVADTPSTPPEAVQPLIDLFADYSKANVSARVRDVYAESLYFRDGFKEFTEIDGLEEYLVHGTEPLRSCVFEFPSVIEDNGDYYLRWVMKANLKRDKEDRVEEVIGLSHVRLNAEGKVVFQQDYWDPSDVLYRRIPVAGWMIHKIKSKL
jgi:hypothetical protein